MSNDIHQKQAHQEINEWMNENAEYFNQRNEAQFLESLPILKKKIQLMINARN